jgi:secreted trypsin-like serine protease
MKTRPGFLVAASAMLAISAGCGADVNSPSDVSSGQSSIVGGTIDSGDPAVVVLLVDGQPFCTGTLIAPRSVLTAAHCVYAYGQSAQYQVSFGTSAATPTRTVGVDSQRAHPDYDAKTFEYDIGIWKLSQTISDVQPLELNPTTLTSSDVGRSIRHVGYGTSLPATGGGGGTKRTVTYTIREIGSIQIESGATGKQTCGGDSGGPALMVTAGSTRERIVGTISYGDETCADYGVDMRVDVTRTWIQQTYSTWEAGVVDAEPVPIPAPTKPVAMLGAYCDSKTLCPTGSACTSVEGNAPTCARMATDPSNHIVAESGFGCSAANQAPVLSLLFLLLVPLRMNRKQKVSPY